MSLHNFFPHPEILPSNKASGDAFLLSSLDNDERKKAIKYAIHTINCANELEAGAVVFHLGKIDIDFNRKKWLQLFDDDKINSFEGESFFENLFNKRSLHQKSYLDAVLFSIDEIHDVAIKQNVKMGIENRYYLHEIPDINEIDTILNKFEGGNIGYWHDCGHAQTRETFGLTKHEDFLKKYSDKLIGIHLHDCIGYKDHIAPGTGEIDFDMIKKYLSDDVIKILELHNNVSLEELHESISFLKLRGII